MTDQNKNPLFSMYKKLELMNTIKNIIRFRNKKVLFIILLSFQFGLANAFGFKEDSLSVKFPINDPRNPNCPCHTYQKLADDEFNKLSGNEITVNSGKNDSNYENTFIGNSVANSKNKIVIKKLRSKNISLNAFYFKKKKQTKRKKVRRLRKDNTACYHF
jgi:hypothetical protein